MNLPRLLDIIDGDDEWDWPNKAYSNRCLYSYKTRLALFEINRIRVAIYISNGVKILNADQELYFTPHTINNRPYLEWLWEHLCQQYGA